MGLFNPALPGVWDLNFVLLQASDQVLRAEDLAAGASELHLRAGTEHRRIVVADERVGARLAPAFRKLGWMIRTLVVMAYGAARPLRSPSALVVEVDEEDVRGTRERFLRTQPYGTDDLVVHQLLEAKDVLAKAVSRRNFAVPAGEGYASICEVYSDGRTAQIEDVATLEEHRGQGFATAVVLRAVEEARSSHDLIFLVADADDWPKKMYAGMGFEAIGRTYELLRLPRDHAPP